MENNRSLPNTYYDYVEYNDYPRFSRNSSPMRNESVLSKKAPLKPPIGNKPCYTGQDNFPGYYPEDQSWNIPARRVPVSSYTVFPSTRQTANQSMTTSQMQNNLTKISDVPLKGILVGGHNESSLEGKRKNSPAQSGNNTNQRCRPHSPAINYRLSAHRSNENLMAAFCGGEPMSDIDDSQYYLINEGKSEQQNFDIEKNMYEDFNLATDDGNSYKDSDPYEYNPDNDMFYDSSVRELANLNLRERPNQVFAQQIYNNNEYANQEASTYDSADPGYYMFQQRSAPRSSHSYSQNRFQDLPRRSRPVVNRRDIYKHVSDKLNETFTELKNAGVSDKKEENRAQRSSNINCLERYSLQDHSDGNKKSILKFQGDYRAEKPEYNKDGGESYTNRQYKYQELIDDNSKRSMMPHLDKYKLDSHNEMINTSLHFPSCKTQELNGKTIRKMVQIAPEEQKVEENAFGESGSFVHMHKEYKKNQSVPGCCTDVYSNYRKEKNS